MHSLFTTFWNTNILWNSLATKGFLSLMTNTLASICFLFFWLSSLHRQISTLHGTSGTSRDTFSKQAQWHCSHNSWNIFLDSKAYFPVLRPSTVLKSRIWTAKTSKNNFVEKHRTNKIWIVPWIPSFSLSIHYYKRRQEVIPSL